MVIIFVIIILVFLLGFCFGALYESKNTKEVLEEMQKMNYEWKSRCDELNYEWYERCERLTKRIAILESEAQDE